MVSPINDVTPNSRQQCWREGGRKKKKEKRERAVTARARGEGRRRTNPCGLKEVATNGLTHGGGQHQETSREEEPTDFSPTSSHTLGKFLSLLGHKVSFFLGAHSWNE